MLNHVLINPLLSSQGLPDNQNLHFERSCIDLVSILYYYTTSANGYFHRKKPKIYVLYLLRRFMLINLAILKTTQNNENAESVGVSKFACYIVTFFKVFCLFCCLLFLSYVYNLNYVSACWRL